MSKNIDSKTDLKFRNVSTVVRDTIQNNNFHSQNNNIVGDLGSHDSSFFEDQNIFPHQGEDKKFKNLKKTSLYFISFYFNLFYFILSLLYLFYLNFI